MTKPTDIWRFDLTRGASTTPRNGACLMDAISWLEYGKLGDEPECVCPVLAAYGRYLNDLFDDVTRQKLKVLIPRLAGSRDPVSAKIRADFIIEESIRRFARQNVDLNLSKAKRAVTEVLLRAASLAAYGFIDSQKIPLFATTDEITIISDVPIADTAPFFEDAIQTLEGAMKLGRQGTTDPEAIGFAQESFRMAALA